MDDVNEMSAGAISTQEELKIDQHELITPSTVEEYAVGVPILEEQATPPKKRGRPFKKPPHRFAKGNKYAFTKGKSGNPNGRGNIKVYKGGRLLDKDEYQVVLFEYQHKAQRAAKLALDRLIEIVTKSPNEMAAVNAAKEINNRAWGQSPTASAIEVTGNIKHETQITFAETLIEAAKQYKREIVIENKPDGEK